MSGFLFSSEAVSRGHPDKIADQISDAILDACLKEDAESRVACETLVTTGLVVLAGEITTHAPIPYHDIVRQVIREIGYDDPQLGFHYQGCGVINTLHKQSPDIARGVDQKGAGDQGLMFGFACDETPSLMPMPIMLSHALLDALQTAKKQLPYLRPDAKSQITLEYGKDQKPKRIHTVVLSTQHADTISHSDLVHDMRQLITTTLPSHLLNAQTHYHINPTGRFVVGGPMGDCGLTGRKLMVDTYGGMAHHGGGAFSGKDPTKVDRSGAYAARWVAKNIVAACLASRCEVQISYAIGVSEPISIHIDTFGTGDEETILKAVQKTFDLTPEGIIRHLHLKRPIYRQTATGGHFGRSEETFTWEKTDQVEALRACISTKRSSS